MGCNRNICPECGSSDCDLMNRIGELERENDKLRATTVRTDNTKTLVNALAEIDRLRGELRYIAEATDSSR